MAAPPANPAARDAGRLEDWAKRGFDLVAAGLGAIVLTPLLAALALWVKADSPGPALFKQTRVGFGGRPFQIYKLRSMVVDAPAAGPSVTAGGDARVTRSGRFLRRHKLDELPQLFNVLKGDMSLVGPRPEAPKYVALWSEDDRRTLLSIRPGITDPASLRFRDEENVLAGAADPERAYIETVMPQKLAMYRDYVATRSFSGDLALIWRTIARLAFARSR